MYHVTSRGNNRRAILDDGVDKRTLLMELGVTVVKFEIEVASYCLMSNHLHLCVKAEPEVFSDAMQRLNSMYARRHNKRHGRINHVFGTPFHSVPIVRDHELAYAVRYGDRNPIVAGICSEPGDWPWSSFRAIAGLAPVPEFLSPHLVLEYFDSDPARARAKYRLFVEGGGGPLTEADLLAWLEVERRAA